MSSDVRDYDCNWELLNFVATDFHLILKVGLRKFYQMAEFLHGFCFSHKFASSSEMHYSVAT